MVITYVLYKEYNKKESNGVDMTFGVTSKTF